MCIDCGQCKEVCAFQVKQILANRLYKPQVFAVKHNDIVRMSSASGGAYTAISDYVLKFSGVIYGVEFDDGFYVRHNRGTTVEEREKFKGSKYIQSDLGETFRQIEKDLILGNIVLFVGTGCQVASLKRYLYIKKINIDIFIFI